MEAKTRRQTFAIRTLEEVGAVLGISKQAVQIIESRALRKARARMFEVLQAEFEKMGENPHTSMLKHARAAREAMRRKRGEEGSLPAGRVPKEARVA